MRALVIVMALALAALAPRLANAQPERPWQLGVTGGFRAGGGDMVGEAQVFAGYTHYFAAEPKSALFLAPGLALGWGSVGFGDPRGVDGELSASRFTVGPALRGGIAWSDHSWPLLYTWVGAAAVRIEAPSISSELAESGGAYATQVSLGLAAPLIQAEAAESEDAYEMLLMILLPNTLELTFEEVRGADQVGRRVGLSFGYSL